MIRSKSTLVWRSAVAALLVGLLLVGIHVSLPHMAPVLSAPLEWATLPSADRDADGGDPALAAALDALARRGP